MEKRTESDILAKAPIKVKLGDKDYKIPVLTVLPAREWRLRLDASLGEIVRNFQPAPDGDTNAFATGLTGALIQFPQKICELLFAYANGWDGKERMDKPILPEEEVLASSTEEQLAAAFSAVMAVAYPFLPQLAMARQAVLGSLAQSARSMNLQ